MDNFTLLKVYQSLGTYEELIYNLTLLKDYQSLGSYEEMADLASRRDIDEHARELQLTKT